MHLDKESLNKAVPTMTVSPRAEYHCEDGGEQSYKSLYNYRATRSNRENETQETGATAAIGRELTTQQLECPQLNNYPNSYKHV